MVYGLWHVCMAINPLAASNGCPSVSKRPSVRSRLITQSHFTQTAYEHMPRLFYRESQCLTNLLSKKLANKKRQAISCRFLLNDNPLKSLKN